MTYRSKKALLGKPHITYPVVLNDEFILRAARHEADIEQLALLNKRIHKGEDVESLVRSLALEHPYGDPGHWYFIEETRTRKIVSSLALIPWHIRFGSVILPAAELGFVGTLPSFRKRGLSRVLTDHFHTLVDKAQYTFSFLQGIPFYYRQFGYEYAVQLENHFIIKLYRLPSRQNMPLIRRAVPADTPRLMQLYRRSMRVYALSTVRSPDIWEYILGPSLKTEVIHDTYCVLDRRGSISAYIRVALHGFGEGLILDEVSSMLPETEEAVLGFLKQLALERRKPWVRLNLHREHPLVKRVLKCGATDEWKYAWQIRIGNLGRFFKSILPVLEERLARSRFKGLSQKIWIDVYRETFGLCFDKGRLKGVSRSGKEDGPCLRLPPFVAVQLFFGHRSLEELLDLYPDVWVDGGTHGLWKTLFPKLKAWFHTNY